MSRPITLTSPAKVNLSLRVLRRRGDGYHDISSLMQPISLCDDITLQMEDGSGVSVECDNPNVPVDGSNLAARAAEQLLRAAGVVKKVGITIRKKIPVGAGLGGGSSNAATVMSGLNAMLGDVVERERLMHLGAEIGSDVPFFFLEGPAIATGRGEELKAVDLPGYGYVLVNPGFEVSTAWAYKNLDLTNRPQDYILTYSREVFENLDLLASYMVNDLEAATMRRYPELGVIKAALLRSGARGALMSGSGPTVFGVYADMDGAVRAVDRLADALPRDKDYFIRAAQGL